MPTAPERDAQPLAGQIWMIDDEVSLVRATTQLLSKEFPGVEFRGTCDPREATAWLARERPSALITDVRMPHVNGLELVTLAHQRWGSVPVVVITAFPTAEVNSAAETGRFAYLAKPFSFQALKDQLRRVCNRPASSAFVGAIAVSMLGEVIQLYGLAGRSGLLVVEAPAGRAEISFANGRVVHASLDALEGIPAFNAVLSWPSGQFHWLDRRPARTTIRLGLAALLMEAYRLKDEGGLAIASPQEVGGDELDLAFPAEPVASPSPLGNNVAESLYRLQRNEGFLAAALVNADTGRCVGQLSHSGGIDLLTVASETSELVRAERQVVEQLELEDTIEDVLITVRAEIQLIRMLKRLPSLFLYLALDRTQANLALARYSMSDAEKDLVL